MKLVNRFILIMAAAASAASQTSVTNRIGISRFRISETATELNIKGLDEAGAEVARLDLKVTDTGRNLLVEVRGQKAFHESRGLAPLHLPLLSRKDRSDLNTFLQDSHVASALEKRGVFISLWPILQADDQASHKCTFAENPVAMGTSCCEMPASTAGGVEELVCIGDRENYGFVDRICTKPMDPNNPCGATGPNGCSVCWAASRTSHCFTAVDSNNPSRCIYEFR
jgi:hypothetical protein